MNHATMPLSEIELLLKQPVRERTPEEQREAERLLRLWRGYFRTVTDRRELVLR